MGPIVKVMLYRYIASVEINSCQISPLSNMLNRLARSRNRFDACDYRHVPPPPAVPFPLVLTEERFQRRVLLPHVDAAAAGARILGRVGGEKITDLPLKKVVVGFQFGHLLSPFVSLDEGGGWQGRCDSGRAPGFHLRMRPLSCCWCLSLEVVVLRHVDRVRPEHRFRLHTDLVLLDIQLSEKGMNLAAKGDGGDRVLTDKDIVLPEGFEPEVLHLLCTEGRHVDRFSQVEDGWRSLASLYVAKWQGNDMRPQPRRNNFLTQ